MQFWRLGPLLITALLLTSCGGGTDVVALEAPALGDDARFDLPFAIEGVETDDQPAVSHLVEALGLSERAAACVVAEAGDALPPNPFPALRFATMFTVERSTLAGALATCALTTDVAAALITEDEQVRSCMLATATEASTGEFLAAVASSAVTNVDNWPNWIPEAANCLSDPSALANGLEADDEPEDLPFRSEPAADATAFTESTESTEPAAGDIDEVDEVDEAGSGPGLVIDFGDALEAFDDTDGTPAEADESVVATEAESGLPTDPGERLATLTTSTDVVTFEPLAPTDSGYELIQREIGAGHAAVAAEVRRGDSSATAALVWMIAWNPDVPADAVFAADWLDWVRDDKVRSIDAIGTEAVERLTEPGNSVSYLLVESDDTALLIADIGGGDALIEALITPLR